jgi:hypothetical protein
MRRPNFFIIGAPKCGTTSLYSWLSQHPRIFMPIANEPTFFADDFPAYRGNGTLADYERLFEAAGPGHLAVGEASVWYLFSQTAVPAILRYQPEARFIVLLRNPAEMIHSLHAHFLQNFNEDEADFSKAWQMQSDRRDGRGVPTTALVPQLLQYADVGSLGAQMERLYRHVQKERVLALFFDDLRADPCAMYRRTLGFLRVPDDGRMEFPRENQNKVNRWHRLAKFLYRPPAWFDRPYRAVKRAFGIRTTGVGTMLHWMNRRPIQRRLESEELRSRLMLHFRDDISLLSDLTGRDLACWQRPLEIPMPADPST